MVEVYLAPPRIGNRYGIRAGEVPAALACSKVKLKGIHMPNMKKNMAAAVSDRRISFRDAKWSAILNSRSFGDTLVFIVPQETANKAENIHASTRIIHGNPVCSMRRCIRMGRTMLPTEPPDAMMPKAVDLRFSNHDTKTPIEAVKTAQPPSEGAMACARMNW